MIILDTDLVSALAKVEGLELILKLFQNQVYITPEIYEELQAPVEYGYSFPKKIFEKISVLDITPKEQHKYREMLYKRINLGKGELEAISVAKERNCLFSSLDKNAVKFARKNGVKIIVLKAILKGLWKKRVCSKEKVKELVDKIEKKDNRTIDTEGVFED